MTKKTKTVKSKKKYIERFIRAIDDNDLTSGSTSQISGGGTTCTSGSGTTQNSGGGTTQSSRGGTPQTSGGETTRTSGDGTTRTREGGTTRTQTSEGGTTQTSEGGTTQTSEGGTTQTNEGVTSQTKKSGTRQTRKDNTSIQSNGDRKEEHKAPANEQRKLNENECGSSLGGSLGGEKDNHTQDATSEANTQPPRTDNETKGNLSSQCTNGATPKSKASVSSVVHTDDSTIRKNKYSAINKNNNSELNQKKRERVNDTTLKNHKTNSTTSPSKDDIMPQSKDSTTLQSQYGATGRINISSHNTTTKVASQVSGCVAGESRSATNSVNQFPARQGGYIIEDTLFPQFSQKVDSFSEDIPISKLTDRKDSFINFSSLNSEDDTVSNMKLPDGASMASAIAHCISNEAGEAVSITSNKEGEADFTILDKEGDNSTITNETERHKNGVVVKKSGDMIDLDKSLNVVDTGSQGMNDTSLRLQNSNDTTCQIKEGVTKPREDGAKSQSKDNTTPLTKKGATARTNADIAQRTDKGVHLQKFTDREKSSKSAPFDNQQRSSSIQNKTSPIVTSNDNTTPASAIGKRVYNTGELLLPNLTRGAESCNIPEEMANNETEAIKLDSASLISSKNSPIEQSATDGSVLFARAKVKPSEDSLSASFESTHSMPSDDLSSSFASAASRCSGRSYSRSPLAVSPAMINCDFCLVQYNETNHLPKRMPFCSHTFCLNCLLGIYRKEGKTVCPDASCLSECPVNPNNLATDEIILKLLEGSKCDGCSAIANDSCDNCELTYCRNCAPMHRNDKACDILMRRQIETAETKRACRDEANIKETIKKWQVYEKITPQLKQELDTAVDKFMNEFENRRHVIHNLLDKRCLEAQETTAQLTYLLKSNEDFVNRIKHQLTVSSTDLDLLLAEIEHKHASFENLHKNLSKQPMKFAFLDDFTSFIIKRYGDSEFAKVSFDEVNGHNVSQMVRQHTMQDLHNAMYCQPVTHPSRSTNEPQMTPDT